MLDQSSRLATCFDVIKVTKSGEDAAVSFSVIDRDNTSSDESIAYKPLALTGTAAVSERYRIVKHSNTHLIGTNEAEIERLQQLAELPTELRYETGRRSVPEWMLVLRHDLRQIAKSSEDTLADRFHDLTGLRVQSYPRTKTLGYAEWYTSAVTLFEIYEGGHIDRSSKFKKQGDADRPRLELGDLCVRSPRRRSTA